MIPSIVKIIAAPLLGGVIGYITNDLALKMLFHPYKALYIGKWHVPFTPGLIPSRKEQIAKSLGKVINEQLLAPETIRREVLSDEVMSTLRAAVSDFLQAQAEDEHTLREKIGAIVPAEKLQGYEDQAVGKLTDFLMERFRRAGLGEIIAQHIISALREKLQLLPFGAMMEAPLHAAISKAVEQRLDEYGPAMIRQQILESKEALLGQPMAALTVNARDQLPALTDWLMALYGRLVERHLEGLLGAARIDQLIEKQINAFSAEQLEKLIFGIMRKELRAIVYLGAGLGCLMGFVNLLF